MFISEVFASCEILREEGDRRVVDADYIRFGYDDTIFHHRRDVVLNATFRLTPGDPAALHRVLQENLSWRGSRHPWLQVHPRAGSVCKKIEGVGAGRLIDQCGLKGYRVGDAQISHIHANILVNLGNATAADVRALIAHAQAAVRDKFGIRWRRKSASSGNFREFQGRGNARRGSCVERDIRCAPPHRSFPHLRPAATCLVDFCSCGPPSSCCWRASHRRPWRSRWT